MTSYPSILPAAGSRTHHPPAAFRVDRRRHSRSHQHQPEHSHHHKHQQQPKHNPYGPSVELTFKFHDERTTPDIVVIDENVLPGAREGDVCQVLGKSGEVLEMFELKIHSPEIKKKIFSAGNGQMSALAGSRLATYRGSRIVTVRTVERKEVEADLLTFYIKDTYITRSDMWHIPSALVGKCITEGQAIDFQRSYKLNINTIHKDGQKVKVALVGAETRAAFRSQSVRYLIFLQMSTEMWYFDETGESYFSKVINSYLPELFHQWREADAHHLVSIVMFTSVDLSSVSVNLPHGVRSRNVRDHYRVVVDRMRVSDWTEIMITLRKEFNDFQRSVLVRTGEDGKSHISGSICAAIKGNILEAINFAATQTSLDMATDDSLRGNLQTIIVSPGTGLFDVEADLLHRTTQNLIMAGLSVDLVCLTRMPLHAVPLFRYRDAFNNEIHCMPHWIDVSFWKSISSESSSNAVWVPRCRIYEIQMMGVMENELSAISVDYLPSVLDSDVEKFMEEYDRLAVTAQTSTGEGSPVVARRQSETLRSSGRQFRDDNPLWTTIYNPSNPTEEEKVSAMLHGNWRHIYPRKSLGRSIKWKSVISPAAMPITTEVFTSPEEFYREYAVQTYDINVHVNDTGSERDRTTMASALRAMVAYRVGMGFQIAVGSIVEAVESQSRVDPQPSKITQGIQDNDCDDLRVYLSTGNQVHRLAVKSNSTITVQLFVRKNQIPSLDQDVIYKPFIQTRYDDDFCLRSIRFPGSRAHERNWKGLDQYIAGDDNVSGDPSRFYRSRYVLIPTNFQTVRMQNLQLRPVDDTVDNMSPEEIRLDGLRKLNDMFYRAQYMTPEERKRERERKKKAIVPELKFYTGSLSAFITQLVQNAGEDESARKKDSIIMKPSERLDRTVKVPVIAQEMQTERGVKFVDRRWHWKLHQHCFVGSEFVAWLLENFKDIDTPEVAIEYGNELMAAGLFHHVEHRHSFLDGHYFYQLSPEYSIPSAQPRSMGWFSSIRVAASLTPSTSTPVTTSSGPFSGITSSVASLADSVAALTTAASSSSQPTQPQPIPGRHGSATSRSASTTSVKSDSTNESSSELADSTMSLDSDWGHRSQTFGDVQSNLKPRVELTKSIKLDVDPLRKSYRREVATLHYDRLHNPESCYHLLFEWLDTTPKFIDDTIAQWGRICDRSGLKLVEVPVLEATALCEIDPFISGSRIKFALEPPRIKPAEKGDLIVSDRLFYQTQALIKLDYVLDTDAADVLSSASPDVEIVYSWGKPHFRYSQYVHKSGATLAQIIPETGEFVIVRNPLVGSKSSVFSIGVDPEVVCREAIDFIQNNPRELREFFSSIREKFLNRPAVAVPFSASPTPNIVGSYGSGGTIAAAMADSFTIGSSSSEFTVRAGTSPAGMNFTDDLERSLSASPSTRRPPPPPSDTPGAASYIYYDIRMF
ncbi:hypothetical protein BZA70DRAFT_290984 [Myxozyma melibiosi]|uniref:Vacuolar membrane-associated protein IML1 n=1 Tax=Myxozyma melibiosi TaxID=54550 RepID=A0ABR1F231_9ASCO